MEPWRAISLTRLQGGTIMNFHGERMKNRLPVAPLSIAAAILSAATFFTPPARAEGAVAGKRAAEVREMPAQKSGAALSGRGQYSQPDEAQRAATQRHDEAERDHATAQRDVERAEQALSETE